MENLFLIFFCKKKSKFIFKELCKKFKTTTYLPMQCNHSVIGVVSFLIISFVVVIHLQKRFKDLKHSREF